MSVEQAHSGHSETQPTQSQESSAKPSRIPERQIIFYRQAVAAGADKNLEERQRLLLEHAMNNPHMTLQELATFGNVRRHHTAGKLIYSGLQALYRNSPLELQQQNPLEELLTRRTKGRSKGGHLSTEHKAAIAAGKKEKYPSIEARAKMSDAKKGKKRKSLSNEQKNAISESMRKRWVERHRQRNEQQQ